MYKILITGAAGFIGSQLAYKLWKNGENVILLDNFSYGKEGNLVFEDIDFRSSILRFDIRNVEELNRLFKEEKFDYVYHMAAITSLPDCQVNPQEATEVNVVGTVNVLEAARIYGVKKVIFSSTSAVYENCTEFPLVENVVVPPSLIYPNTKYACEQFCKSYCDVYGMNIVCLRFTNVFGPHVDCLRKQPPVIAYIVRELYNNRSPILHSNGEQKRDYIYVDDLIELAILVRKGSGFDLVNVSSNEAHSINELYTIICRQMKKNEIQAQFISAEKYWNKYQDIYTGEYSISEEKIVNEVNKYTLLDNKHAQERYGWKPKIIFEDGIKHTIQFIINQLNN